MDVTCKMRVAFLIYLHDGIEKFLYSLAGAAYGRDDRHSEKISQLFQIQGIPFCLKFVIHVQGHHHPYVHVYKLGCKIQVPLKIGCVDYIHNHIRHVLDEVLSDVKFLRTVCGKGICTGEIYDLKMVSAMDEGSFLGIHGDSAVVSDMFMTAGRDIEKGCLSAVRISNKSHLDDLASFLRQVGHLSFYIILSCGIKGWKRLPFGKHALRFGLADHLDLGSLFTTKRHLITYYLIFDRIPERGIQDHLDLVALHETHFNYPFTEASMAVHLHDDTTLPCFQFR